MKTIIAMFVFLGTVFASELPEEFNRLLYEKGEKVFDNKCMECHEKSMPIPLLMRNFIEENNKLLNLKAPTGNEISFRLKQQIGSRDDMEFHLHQTEEFLKDYLYNPDLSKTICLEGVIRHFEVMPSMKGKISEEEISEVNHFLYFLEGFNGVNKFYHDETKF
ncbi:hypothetical protein [Arcobacter cloacae]|uniref:Uncharacterized protein n=1 Tax=Arcobacter cloacae TaxID=1054034 RepID=A0A6M8NQE3_9BACT|nr:hypothetical protein [Arcobacter cloacae]NCB12096.1 hypothetical protein [Erysipelotrichia bacterium]QKF88566.1 hypothetical protein ACLO_0017 [Arcobacter cloacae]RXI41240.1 hypothetical protein CP963_07530 [Arcobacter cloacae]